MGKAKTARRKVDAASKVGSGNGLPKHRGLMCLACAVLLAVTVGVYWQATGYSFIDMDDELYVFANPHVTSGLSPDSIKWSLTGVAVGNWHPLTMLSLMTDYQLAGPNPRLFHAMNIIFHALNTLLLIFALTRMTGSFWRSWFVGALFALHPAHVESVAWVSERKDVLSTLFWLLAMLAYLGYAKKPGAGRYLLVALAFVLGLMCKPMVVSLPLVLLMLDWWPLGRWGFAALPAEMLSPRVARRRSNGRLVFEKLPLLALALASCVVTFIAQRSDGAVGSIDAISVGARLANAVTAYVKYAVKLVWPGELAPFYPHPVNSVPIASVAVCALILVGVTVLVVRAARTRPYLAVGWFWYLVTLVPVIGLVQVGAQSMADRYTYVPYIGLFIMAVWGLPELAAKLRVPGKALAVAGLVALAAFTVKTDAYLPTWTDDVPFWRQITVANPSYGRGYYNLGLQLAKAGDIDAAVEQYERALKVEPDCPGVHNNLANILNDKGMIDEAIEHYKAEIKLNPRHALAHNNLGIALSKAGDLGQAIKHYRDALKIDPGYADAQRNLAVALMQSGRSDEAAACYRELLRSYPDDYRAHCDLAVMLQQKKQYSEAEEHFTRAIEIEPNKPDAYNNFGNMMFGLGKLDKAAQMFRRAASADPSSADARYNLAVALASQGKVDRAIESYQDVLRIKPDYYWAHNNLGLLLASRGRTEEACEHFAEAIRIDPKIEAARANLAMYRK